MEESVRPWGRFIILDEGPGWKIKRIEVMPGHRLSLQSHKHRSEHWFVIQGELLFDDGETERIILERGAITIAAGSKHRMANVGNELLIVLETQFGDYLGEDDIYRYNDDYGR